MTFWLVFNVVIAVMLYLDLGVINKHVRVISLKEAALWSAVWVLVALGFCGWVGLAMGRQKSLEFLTGYLIEESLSVDNMFVFVMIFEYFRVPPRYQPRVLKWGILGALVMRFLLIVTGVALFRLFHWMIYLFGVLLVFTGFRMATEREQAIEPERNPILKLFRRLMPVAADHQGDAKFFIRRHGRRFATPLFITLLIVEASDLVFAVDSIPAVLAISTDPFIVYTSNAFAILGLRALYFLLSGMMGFFAYLKIGISVILAFVGVKMLLSSVYHVSTFASLGVIAAVLTVSIVASLLDRRRRSGARPV